MGLVFWELFRHGTTWLPAAAALSQRLLRCCGWDQAGFMLARFVFCPDREEPIQCALGSSCTILVLPLCF